MKLKRALVSVSDKTGLVELLSPLVKDGLEIVSTGGTAQFLKSHGINCISVSDVTDFPEVMGGRVKTLHPKIHMSLLARDLKEDQDLLKEFGLKMFDLVVCNLYPFEKVSTKPGATEEEIIENIDIGGPTISRAAAKNFKSIIVLSDPKDYLDFSQKYPNQVDLNQRKKWAAKVFEQTSRYDSLIAKVLLKSDEQVSTSQLEVKGSLVQELRYGENSHQKAFWYSDSRQKVGLHQAQILQGKELSYNNLLDLESSCGLVQLFDEPAVVAVKHNNPCGVASDKNIFIALKKAMSADPVSVFGGIVAINQPVTEEMASSLENYFLECIIAPSFEEKAKTVFSKKKNLRILSWPQLDLILPKNPNQMELKSISGGYLLQSSDLHFGSTEGWLTFGEKPSSEVLQDMVFGERVCAFQKSNAIALVKGQMTLGLGMGQVNRIDALELSIQRWKKFHSDIKDPVLVSDAFFPFADSIDLAHQNGIRWVLQPGGSVRDDEVKARAAEYGVTLVMSGVRHFKH